MNLPTNSWSHFETRPPINVIQGEFSVSSDSDVYMATVLGSCIAVCMFDPINRVGGMNHILLPGGDNSGAGHSRYGIHLMELLINGLLRKGADKSNLQAKLFGGARISVANSGIGKKNAEFADSFLQAEGIPVVSKSIGGTLARKVHFIPTSGIARQHLIEAPVSLQEVEKPKPIATPKPEPEDITLF